MAALREVPFGRLETYVITGPRGSGVIGINGAAARLVHPGDLVILIAYGVMDDAEARTFQPRVVFVDADAVDLLETVDVSTSEVVVLDAGTNGVEQMANHLQGRTGIDTIHVLSHGSAGQLELGSGLLNLSTLQGDCADELATIRAALSPDADLLIYGCDVASTEEGEAFVAALAQATGADVAASIDDTGALALGGDWCAPIARDYAARG